MSQTETQQTQPLESLHYEFKTSSVLTKERVAYLYYTFLQSCRIPGDVAEFGVFQGETSRELARAIQFLGLDKHLWMFDTCKGLPTPSGHDTLGDVTGQYNSSLEKINLHMAPDDGQSPYQYTLYVGLVEETIVGFDKRLAFAHVDVDLYEPTRVAIEACTELMSLGGMMVIDDYGTEWTGVTKAADEVLRPHPGWVCFQKTHGQLIAQRIP